METALMIGLAILAVGNTIAVRYFSRKGRERDEIVTAILKIARDTATAIAEIEHHEVVDMMNQRLGPDARAADVESAVKNSLAPKTVEIMRQTRGSGYETWLSGNIRTRAAEGRM